MSEFKEGQKVAVETEVTAVHPEWVAVRVQFGRMVQNIRVDKAMVRALDVELTDREINADLEAAGIEFDPRDPKPERMKLRGNRKAKA